MLIYKSEYFELVFPEDIFLFSYSDENLNFSNKKLVIKLYHQIRVKYLHTSQDRI